MKIKKIINESLLTEADELEDGAVIDTTNNAETLDKIEAEAEDNDISNPAEIAGEIIADANKINADTAVVDLDTETSLGVENKITKALDHCLKVSQKLKKRKEVPNIMICGLPGSGKTASVYDWAARATANGEKVNVTYLNMKNNDLDAFINGYTTLDKDDPDFVKQAFSRNLDGLEQPNSILFLDEYNRQTDDQVRASVLTLINEHYVVGKDKGKHYFPNFLFTIAVMNPHVRTDRGAANLNDAEKSRFLYYFDNMDSDPETTKAYLDKQYGFGEANKGSLVMQELKKAEPDYDEIEENLRIRDLGMFIIEDPDFKYDSKNDLSELDRTGKKMLNQRSLTAGLAACNGDVDDFKFWLEGGANFLQDKIERILNILATYSAPTRAELFKEAGITDPTATEEKEEPVDDKSTDIDTDILLDLEDDEELEDDDDPDFFTSSSGGSSSKIKTPMEVEDILKQAAQNW